MTIRISDELVDNISLDELKQLAKKKGFYLKPITEYNKMVPCICGANYHKRVEIPGNRTMYVCKRCGFSGLSGIGNQQARDGWNRAIRNYHILNDKKEDKLGNKQR